MAKTNVKMKELDPVWGGGMCWWHPPLDLPMLMIAVCTCDERDRHSESVMTSLHSTSGHQPKGAAVLWRLDLLRSVDTYIRTYAMDKTQLRHPLQLKIVGSDHRDAPDALLPVRTLNGLNPRRSREQSPLPLMCSSFYTQKVM